MMSFHWLRRCIRFYSSSTNICPKLATMKLSDERMHQLMKPGVKILENLLNKNGYEIRIAGGAVRDLLMGIIPVDLDFATTATPNQMKKMFNEENIRIISSGGEKHGTITTRIEEENYELTTLRIDRSTDGRHAEVEFIQDWELDAGRRDLTINAMYLGMDGTIYDYFDGISHISERRIAFVGAASKRMKEDYLRILRYFRFYGRVANEPSNHDLDTLNIIKENAHGLSQISGPRIWVELKKIILGRFAEDILITMQECDLFPHIGIDGNFDGDNVRRVYSVCNGAGLNISEFCPSTLLASGFDNEDQCMKLVGRVMCSNKDKEAMLFIVRNRSIFFEAKSFQTVMDFHTDLIYLHRKSSHVALFLLKETLRYCARTEFLYKCDSTTFPVFPVQGNMLLYKIKTKKDRKMMKVYLNQLLETWKNSNYSLSAEELVSTLE